MQMPGRDTTFKNSYRYGFNGQEKSNELNSDGNLYSAEFWEYDSRIGRRWNLDPKPTVGISPYNCFSGNPILFSDIKGDSIINPTSTSQVDNDYKPWMSLLLRNAPSNTLKQANGRFYIQSFRDQPTSQAYGADLNLDLYKLDITKLPPGFSNAGELFTYIRINFGKFINGSVSTFEPYDKGEKKIWESSNPNSSIMRFKGFVNGRNLDDADVLTVNYVNSKDYASWIFRPISNYNIINPVFGG